MVRGRSGASPRPASTSIDRLVTSSALFGVFATRGQHVCVPGRLRQANGHGSIALVDLTLVGQVPMLLRPRIRRVVSIDRGGSGPGRTRDENLRWSVKAVVFKFVHFILLRAGPVTRTAAASDQPRLVPNHYRWRLSGVSALRPEILRVERCHASFRSDA